ncbi:hypothetical protein [Subtercola frigoramans]|uniref:Uncharacterized protein n=1 Tax=Subtercola frigoramans TaxID=120298 RepID=A0ABS2L3T6_9MICO|nr:hypothetical protein [Subtercola frigoramans]MBM7471708.1 hypothetical protein [Subtercola frigoramans]
MRGPLDGISKEFAVRFGVSDEPALQVWDPRGQANYRGAEKIEACPGNVTVFFRDASLHIKPGGRLTGFCTVDGVDYSGDIAVTLLPPA